jgi:subtilase family serine protease
MLSTVRRLCVCSASACLLFASGLHAQSLPNVSVAPPERQITGPIEESNLQQLTGNPRPSRIESDLGRVPDNLPQGHILMLLKRSAGQEQALEQLMKEQYDPQSPNFHKWLTPDQFGSLFGPSQQDVTQLTQWLSAHGFTVNRVAPGRTFIDFSGTAGQVAAAFHSEIHHFRIRGEDHLANAGDPMIPASLAGVVSGFRGLSDIHPKPLAQKPGRARLDRKTGKWSSAAPGHFTLSSGSSNVYLVGPQDFAEIYGVNQVWQQTVNTPSGPQKLVGTGQTIGVIGDVDIDLADIQSFRDQLGITALGPNGSVVVDHPPAAVCAAAPSADSIEPYIDTEWAGAAAPDATIDFVTCADTNVTAGTDLAASYIVQDPAHARQDAVLSSSYGFCEQNPQSESNQFYIQLWQQAAAEGITVVAATGDAGGAECDEPFSYTYVNHGLAISGESSTPYNVAAGGTDLSDVFSGTIGNYWSTANATNLESVKSYIPETPWNESCASPLVLQAFNEVYGTTFDSSSGPNGLCTYASGLPQDPSFLIPPTFDRFAGTGGLSIVSPRPAWQTGVTGLPSGNARALPDISLFASSGFTWGHSLIFCYSGTNSGCDFTSPNTLFFDTAGGTSFAAPAFSGIMALINQKNGRQGQANNILYPLAAQQYISSNSKTQPSLATCAAYLGTSVLPGCYFHDISGTPNPNAATQQQIPFLMGTTAIPCTGSATAAGVFTDTSTDPASNSEDCYGYQITVTQNGNTLTTTPNYYGLLSTAENANSPAFPATPGYDLATGLGSPNVSALVNAPQWSTGALQTAVSVTPLNSTITPVQTVRLVATVTTQSGGNPVRGGSLTFYSGSTQLGQASLTCGGRGSAALSVTGAAFGGMGAYNDVYAVYSGGTAQCGRNAVYFGSKSTPVTVTVVLAAATIAGSPLYPSGRCCFFDQPYPLVVDVTGDAGSAPTGGVQVQFDGQTIGMGILQANSSRTSAVTVFVNAASLAVGNNTVSLLYAGDGNYLPATRTGTVAIQNPSAAFGVVPVNTSSEIGVEYTFVEAGTITLNYNPGGAPSNDFTAGTRGTCQSGASQAAGYHCTIGIRFRPSLPGVRHGVVQVRFQPEQAGSTTSLYLFTSGVGGAAQISLSSMTQVTLNSSLNQPQSSTFDPAGRNLYVANSAGAEIETLPPAGGPLTPWNTGGVSLTYPVDLTFDAFGNFLVADGPYALAPSNTPGKILRFTPGGSSQTVATGTISLSIPTAIREDGSGNLFIADGGLGELIEVPAQGAAPSVVRMNGLNLSFPQALALDNAEQNLYVGDGNTSQLLRVPLNSSGTATPVNLSPCDATISNCSLSMPSGAAFNLNGDMYVVDSGNLRVLKIPRNGAPTTLMPITGLANPSSITLDASGNLYVPDVSNGAMYKLIVGAGSASFGGKTGVSIPVTVTNTGNEDLAIRRITFGQGKNSSFSETDNCTSVTIAPGDACTINIQSSSASAKDVLTVRSNAISTATISVSGN